MELTEEAFEDIIKELERKKIEPNYRRLTSGRGRSQTFGVVNRHSLPPDYSRNCWKRPKLYYHLLEFAEKYVDVSFNAITVNQNYKALPHRDKGNCGISYLVAFGDYTGGELELMEGEKKGVYDINRKPIKEDFTTTLHQVLDFCGNRYSLVFYKANTRGVILPPPSVKMIENEYVFFRGDTKCDGLPHHNKKKRDS